MERQEENFKVLTGKDNRSLTEGEEISDLRMSDGPHGLRYVVKEEGGTQYSEPAVCYPTSLRARQFV